jgi:hypothetical protein
MMAAGCIPVVNDTAQVRIDLDNPFVHYTPAYPGALASELEAIVDVSEFESVSRAAAESVHTRTWEEACATVDTILRRALKIEG